MRLKASIIALAAAALLGPAGAHAAILNGSFEENLDDWSANEDLIQVLGGFYHRDADGVVDSPEFQPIDGYFLGLLNADAADTPTLLSQTFTTTGGVFSGWAAFLGEDVLPFDDHGFVRIFNTASDLQVLSVDLYSASLGSLGDYGYTPWTRFSTNLAAGQYTIEAGVANGGDGFNPSYLLVDNFSVAETAVPEPMTWALMLTGFFGMGAALRRRRLRPLRVRRD